MHINYSQKIRKELKEAEIGVDDVNLFVSQSEHLIKEQLLKGDNTRLLYDPEEHLFILVAYDAEHNMCDVIEVISTDIIV